MIDENVVEDSDKKDHDSSNDSYSAIEEDKIPEPMIRFEDSKSSLLVLMKAQTWDRESHGLYDYESRRVQKLEQKLESEGTMVRGKDTVSFQKEPAPLLGEEDTMLFRLKRRDGKPSLVQTFCLPIDLWPVV